MPLWESITYSFRSSISIGNPAVLNSRSIAFSAASTPAAGVARCGLAEVNADFWVVLFFVVILSLN